MYLLDINGTLYEASVQANTVDSIWAGSSFVEFFFGSLTHEFTSSTKTSYNRSTPPQKYIQTFKQKKKT